MPHNSGQNSSSASRRSRAWAVVLALVCLGVLMAALAPMLLLYIGFGQAMSSFGPTGHESQPGRGLQLIACIVIGAIPLLIFLLRRAFSHRDK